MSPRRSRWLQADFSARSARKAWDRYGDTWMASEPLAVEKLKHLNYDVCVVCRKGKTVTPDKREGPSKQLFLESCRTTVKELYDRDDAISDSDILTAVMGQYLLANGSVTEQALVKLEESVAILRSELRTGKREPAGKRQETLPSYGFLVEMRANHDSAR